MQATSGHFGGASAQRVAAHPDTRRCLVIPLTSRLLVAEDDTALQDTLQSLLEEEGYAVTVTASVDLLPSRSTDTPPYEPMAPCCFLTPPHISALLRFSH